MAKQTPIILNTEISKLPFRCLAALAHRSLRRAEETMELVFEQRFRGKTKSHFDNVVDLLMQVRTCERGTTSASEIIPWSLYSSLEEVEDKLPASNPRRIVFIAARQATRLYGRKTNQVIGYTMELSDCLQNRALARRLRFLIANAAFQDHELLHAKLREGVIGEKTPIPDSLLGDLWRMPVDWTLFLPDQK